MALAIAAIGLYGVVAYSVEQRTRELAVRMALGADGRAIMKLVVREGVSLGLVGVALGTAVASPLARTLSAFLYGVGPTDVPSFTYSSAFLVGVILVASYGPARRATRIEPLDLLRRV